MCEKQASPLITHTAELIVVFDRNQVLLTEKNIFIVKHLSGCLCDLEIRDNIHNI